MDPLIAQSTALVCWGNARLRSGPHLDLLIDNSAFRYCESIRFLRGNTREAIAESPEEWFVLLRDQGATELSLEFVAAGATVLPRSADGLTCFIRTCGGSDAGDWSGSLHPAESSERAGQAWLSEFRILPAEACRKHAPSSPEECFVALREAIVALRVTLERYDHHAPAKTLARTEAAMGAGEFIGAHQDMAPTPAYGLQARLLLDACQSSWIYSGMGSWGDTWAGVSADDPRMASTARHWEAIQDALQVAAGTGL